MAAKSRIEWTERTWNPVTGCTNVSPGCKHCYARVFAERLKAMGTPGYENGFEVTLQPKRLQDPKKHRSPTLFFVNSMSDLFHEQVPFTFVDKIFDVINSTPQHRYQILTKRPGRMAKYFTVRVVPKNAWLGVSVENRKHGVPRIELLREIRAPVRFLSIEPLLEDLGPLSLDKIDWVIVGGESGRGARPMRIEWVRQIRDQCLASEVPFFFKQWGAWGVDNLKRSKKANGRELDGRTWDQLPRSKTLIKGSGHVFT
jgi:protein gp37